MTFSDAKPRLSKRSMYSPESQFHGLWGKKIVELKQKAEKKETNKVYKLKKLRKGKDRANNPDHARRCVAS